MPTWEGEAAYTGRQVDAAPSCGTRNAIRCRAVEKQNREREKYVNMARKQPHSDDTINLLACAENGCG